MDILIVGAGALGALFAMQLAPLARVALYTTNAAHAEAINTQGLCCTGMDGQMQRSDIPAFTCHEDYGRRADLSLLCVKTWATATAAATAQALSAPNALILTLQNGLGNLEQIAALVGPERATAGITAQAATLLAPGHVRHAGQGLTVLGQTPDQASQVTAVAGLFNQAGIDTQTSPDIQALLWSKLIVNAGINALAALMRTPNGTLAAQPACAGIVRQAVAEAVAVGQALGLELDPEAETERVLAVCRQTSGNQASMLQDILRGRRTEIMSINGALVARGRECGVPTPVSQMLCALVLGLEATASARL